MCQKTELPANPTDSIKSLKYAEFAQQLWEPLALMSEGDIIVLMACQPHSSLVCYVYITTGSCTHI